MLFIWTKPRDGKGPAQCHTADYSCEAGIKIQAAPSSAQGYFCNGFLCLCACVCQYRSRTDSLAAEVTMPQQPWLSWAARQEFQISLWQGLLRPAGAQLRGW